MFINNVYVDGFLVFNDSRSVDFSQGLTVLTGPNGSGKSTVQQAVQWALTGETRIPSDITSIVNKSSTSARVDIVFTHQGTQYKVSRTRGKSGGTLDAWENSGGSWVSITSSRNAKDLQHHLIHNIIGVTPDTLHSLMFIDQKGDGNRFTGAKAEDRRSILISMIPDLTKWDQHHKKLKDEVSSAKKGLASLVSTLEAHQDTLRGQESRLDSLNNQLSGVDIDSLKKVLAAATKGLNDKVSGSSDTTALKERLLSVQNTRKDNVRKAREKKADLRGVFDELKEIKSDVNKNITDRDQLSDDINTHLATKTRITESLSDLDAQIAKLSDQAPELGTQREELIAQEATARESVRAAQKKLDNLQDTATGEDCLCPVCDNQLDERQVSVLIQDAESLITEHSVDLDRIVASKNTLQKSIDELNDKFAELSDAKDDAEARVVNIDSDVVNMRAKMQSLQDGMMHLATRASGVSGVIANAMNIHEQIDVMINSVREDHAAVVTDIDPSDEELQLEESLRDVLENNPDTASAQAAVDKANDELESALSLRSAAATVQDSVNSLKSTVQQVESDMDAAQSRLDILETLRDAASPKGVPSTLISSLLEDIAAGANDLATSVMDKPVQVSFSLEKSLKNGSTKPTLDIWITMDGTTRIIESLSGGEMAAVTMAIMLSMVRTVNQRCADTVETLFLDEAMAPLDRERVPSVVSVLKNSGVVDAVVCVSHDPEVIGAADTIIRTPVADTQSVVKPVATTVAPVDTEGKTTPSGREGRKVDSSAGMFGLF